MKKKKSLDELQKEKDERKARVVKTVPARKETALYKPEAKYNDDGVLMVTQSWGQQLPALSDTEYFWNVLDDVRKNLTHASIERYAIENNLINDLGEIGDNINLILKYANWVLKSAEASAHMRDKERELAIREVRRDIGFYDDEGTTEEEFEDS